MTHSKFSGPFYVNSKNATTANRSSWGQENKTPHRKTHQNPCSSGEHKQGSPSTRFINGDRFDFVDEVLGDQFVLTIRVNGRPAVSYPINEIEIAGGIKNTVPFDAQHRYFVVITNRRVKDIYINPKNGMVGSRYDLRAIYKRMCGAKGS